jgi:hypothetical protein
LAVIVLIWTSIAGVEIDKIYARRDRTYFRIYVAVAQTHVCRLARGEGRNIGPVHLRKSRPLLQDGHIRPALASRTVIGSAVGCRLKNIMDEV